MSTPKVIQNTKTHYSVASLKFTHHWLLTKVRTDLSEEQWFELCLNYGLQFATSFSNMFGIKQQEVFEQLTQTPANEGEPYNWFWMWWKLQWMQDDFHFIDQKIYLIPAFNYEYYKGLMLQCNVLEEDLLFQLQSH